MIIIGGQCVVDLGAHAAFLWEHCTAGDVLHTSRIEQLTIVDLVVEKMLELLEQCFARGLRQVREVVCEGEHEPIEGEDLGLELHAVVVDTQGTMRNPVVSCKVHSLPTVKAVAESTVVGLGESDDELAWFLACFVHGHVVALQDKWGDLPITVASRSRGARAVRRAAQHNELASARGNNCIRHRLGSYLSGDVVLEIWDLFQPELHDLIHCTDELRGLGAWDTVPVGQAERLDWSMSMAVVGSDVTQDD